MKKQIKIILAAFSIFFNTEISNYTMIDYAMTSHMLVSDDGKVIYVAWNNAAPN